MNHNSLSGRTALVTGASGIAAATAALFAQQGAFVAVLDCDASNLTAIEERLPGVLTIERDLTRGGVAQEAVDAVMKQQSRLDILVNIAGISGRKFGDGPVHEATDAGWDAVMDINAKATFALCRAALKPMMAQGSGSIVNMASALAFAPAAKHFAAHAYAASNGARIALTKSMAAYYAPHGIRVNAVAPGVIATPMSQRAQNDPAILDYIKSRQPLTGTLGQPNDVAEAILYLASDASQFVTGVVLEVSGGWSVAG